MQLAWMIIKALPALILVFFVWPITLGAGLGLKKNIDRYLIGFASVQAFFFLLYIPAICFAWSSRTLAYIAAIVITIVGLSGNLIRYFRSPSRKDFLALSKPNFRYLKNPLFLVAIFIVIYEMWIYATKEPYIYGDDVIYLRVVNNIVETNSIYAKSFVGQIDPTPLTEINFKHLFTSYYPFLAMVSLLTKLHPLVLCKTIIPIIYLPVHYLIVWRVSQFLFMKENDKCVLIEKQSVFLFIYALLIEFGQISYYTLSRRVTIWIYNSKSDCFVLLLPILFFYTYWLFLEKNDLNIRYRQLIIAIMALACNSSTLMGVIMSAFVVLLWVLILAVRTRKPLLLLSSVWVLIPHAITGVLLVQFTNFSI